MFLCQIILALCLCYISVNASIIGHSFDYWKHYNETIQHFQDADNVQCLDDSSYCYDDSECCSGVCSHHWPPTTTPVFGVCGEVPECQALDMWCKDEWSDAQCCDQLHCVNIDGENWGLCTL